MGHLIVGYRRRNAKLLHRCGDASAVPDGGLLLVDYRGGGGQVSTFACSYLAGTIELFCSFRRHASDSPQRRTEAPRQELRKRVIAIRLDVRNNLYSGTDRNRSTWAERAGARR